MAASLLVSELFIACDEAIAAGEQVIRTGRDKEFALQNWLAKRLESLPYDFVENKRNAYPDFWIRADERLEVGIESKGLETPGRFRSFDGNSRLPSGEHEGLPVYYAFARYPKTQDAAYMVLDFVLFHADLVNPPSDYAHVNKNVPIFGGYGDVMIRDRKMYVLKTPYELLVGLAGAVTLIVPADERVAEGLTTVGAIERVEADEAAVSYAFDLRTNDLSIEKGPNPSAGKTHTFAAYQRRPSGEMVRLADSRPIQAVADE